MHYLGGGIRHKALRNIVKLADTIKELVSLGFSRWSTNDGK